MNKNKWSFPHEKTPSPLLGKMTGDATMVLQIANITKDTPDLLPLLEQAYARVFVPAFPVPESRESLDKFLRAMNGGIKGVSIVINVMGENLDDPQARVIKGFSVAYYYEKHNVGLLAYNAIAPEAREKGLGKIMVQSRIQSLKDLAAASDRTLAGVFVDVNDPSKIRAEDDGMDPVKRLQIFTNWGAVRTPVDYVQPPLEAGGNYCDTMLLLNYPVDGRYADRHAIEMFLRSMYRECRQNQRPEEDYFFRQMKTQLDAAPESAMPNAQTCAEPGYMKDTPSFTYLKTAFNQSAAPRALMAAAAPPVAARKERLRYG